MSIDLDGGMTMSHLEIKPHGLHFMVQGGQAKYWLLTHTLKLVSEYGYEIQDHDSIHPLDLITSMQLDPIPYIKHGIIVIPRAKKWEKDIVWHDDKWFYENAKTYIKILEKKAN